MRNTLITIFAIGALASMVALIPFITPTWISARWFVGLFTASVVGMLATAQFIKK